jgi:hypothetical protein
VPEELRRFPNLVVLLVTDLRQFVAGDATRTGYVTPADLADRLEFIQIRRVPGSAHDRITDHPTIDIDLFAATYDAADALAARVDAYLCLKPPPLPAVDAVVHTDGPHELPWEDPNIRRIGLSYVMDTRRRIVLP